MQTVQGNRIESLRAVIDFVSEHADHLPAVARSGAYQKLAATVAQVMSFAEQQAASRGAGQGETQLVHALREALLHDHLTPIVRMAHVERTAVPALAVLRMPNEKQGAAKLASAALEMANAAEAHAERFTALGLPADFVGRLRVAIREMEDAIDERAQCRGRRAGATAGLRALLGLGRKYVLVLDALVRSSVKGDAALVAGWEAVSHVRKVRVRSGLAAVEILESAPRKELRLLPAITSAEVLLPAMDQELAIVA